MKQQSPLMFEGRVTRPVIVLLMVLGVCLGCAPGLFGEDLSGRYVRKTESLENRMHIMQSGRSLSMVIDARSDDGVMNFVDSTGALTDDTGRFDLEDGCLFFIKFQKTTATLTTKNCKTIEGVGGIYYTGTYRKAN